MEEPIREKKTGFDYRTRSNTHPARIPIRTSGNGTFTHHVSHRDVIFAFRMISSGIKPRAAGYSSTDSKYYHIHRLRSQSDRITHPEEGKTPRLLDHISEENAKYFGRKSRALLRTPNTERRLIRWRAVCDGCKCNTDCMSNMRPSVPAKIEVSFRTVLVDVEQAIISLDN